MNFINKAFLKLALLPSGLYRKMDVDTGQLKSILNTKLLMDDRRPGSLQHTRKRKRQKPLSMATVGTMLMSTLLGLVYLVSFYIGRGVITHLVFYFTFFFFMLSLTLIADFTSVLIDVRDNYIILPKPVNDRTFILARLLHIFIHISKLVLPMSLPGLVKVAIDYGWVGAVLFLLLILCLTIFCIFFINAVYILILRITTPQRFQAIISYVQIFFALILYASFQILPRLMSSLDLADLDIGTKRGIIYYPMYWFACGWKVLYTIQGNTTELLCAAAAFVLPFLSLYIVVKYLAPSFNNKLALINASAGTPQEQRKRTKTTKTRSSYAEFLSSIFTRSNPEKMGFLFTWKMTARSRDFKMKVYPSIGYLVVYVVLMFMNKKHLSLEEIAEQNSEGKIIVISALYFTSLLLTMALNQIIYSDKYKASWIYYISPVRRPGEVILGGAKAAIFKFYIPLIVFVTVAGLSIIGPKLIPNIILGLFNELLIATILVYVSYKIFPFSMHQNTSAKSGTFLRNFGVFSISGVIALGHYMIYDIPAAVILCAVLSIIATWMMMVSIKNTSWEAIREMEN